MPSTNNTISLPETQRARRGHNFNPPAATRRNLPALYATEGTQCRDKTLWAKWFLGSTTWYAAEVDWDTGNAFGYVDDGPHSEWGYFNLTELERASKGWLVVERDMWFRPVKASEVTGR